MSAGYQKKKTPLNLGCLDGMTMPIRRTPITREYRKTRKVRTYQHSWHIRHYTPHPRQEPDCDPAEIQARIAQIRREKTLLRAVGRLD